MDEKKIKLGDEYRDTISGFTGIATSRHEYIHGCTRITLTAPGKDGSVPVFEAFDAPALESTKTREKVTSRRTGGPRPTPTSRTTA